MKKTTNITASAGRFVLAALGISLVVSAVSCKTAATPDKPVGTAGTRQVPDANQPVKATDKGKPVFTGYYTCGMHPEVRSLDPDGKCPICNMPFLPADTVMVVDPVSGETNTAARFPVVSGYYSCAMHPTVLSRAPDAKCPDCHMPLLPVENPIFTSDK